MKTVVVTGANGYIGSRVVQDLLKAGYKVRGTVRDPHDEKYAWLHEIADGYNDHLELVSIPNIVENVGWDEAFAGADYIIHTAARLSFTAVVDAELEIVQPNIRGVEHCLNAALKAGVKRVVFTSTMAAVCGFQRRADPNHLWTEDDWNDEMGSAYSKSKTLSERVLWDFHAAHPELEVVSINPGLTFGPILHKECVGSAGFVLRCIKGIYAETGAPTNTFGISDVRDVSESILRTMIQPECANQRYLVTNKGSYSQMIVAGFIEDSFPGEFTQVLPTRFKEDAKVETRENSINNSKVIALFGRDVIHPRDIVRDTIISLKACGVYP